MEGATARAARKAAEAKLAGETAVARASHEAVEADTAIADCDVMRMLDIDCEPTSFSVVRKLLAKHLTVAEVDLMALAIELQSHMFQCTRYTDVARNLHEDLSSLVYQE